MATFTDLRAVYGLSATATLASTNATTVSGTVGVGQTAARFEDADVVYSLRAILCGSADELIIDLTANDTTGSTAFVAGAAQVETATITAASGATSSGNLPVVITSGVVAGSPLTVNVALVTGTHTTATLIANKCATDLNASAAGTYYFFTNSGASLQAVRKPTSEITVPGGTLSIYPATDSTLNIEIPAGLGVTAAPTSTGTTAGTATSGTKIYDGDGKDVEGVALPTISFVNAALLQCTSGTVIYENGTASEKGQLTGASSSDSGIREFVTTGTATSLFDGNGFTFTADTEPVDITITVVGTV